MGSTQVDTGARFTQPRAGWLRRVAWLGCLLWLAGHAVALAAVPDHAGLAEWASPERLIGPRWAVVARLVFVSCLAALIWPWTKQRLRLKGDLGRVWRVGAGLTAAFMLLHLAHIGSVFRVADPIATQRLPELNDRLAASLSSTHWGVPWLALAYLAGSIAAGILSGVELWLASRNVPGSQTWKRQRTWRFLSVCVGILIGGASLRALLYFATGAHFWH